jgi:hypothetical protein
MAEAVADYLAPALGGPDDLERLRRVRELCDTLQAELRLVIAGAYARGHSLRVIAAAAGISHEQARRVARRDAPWRARAEAESWSETG